MKRWILSLFCTSICAGQIIPRDSLYLGQSPPGNTPVMFRLPAGGGLFPAERIAISSDGAEIYYSELNGYPPTIARTKYFKYINDRWTGPFVVMNNYYSPAISPDGKKLFVETSQFKTWYALKNDTGWNSLQEFWSEPHDQHYLQVTRSGKYYLKSDRVFTTVGDISQLNVQGGDTTVQSLGIPINSSKNGADYFISNDDSFIVSVIKSNGLGSLGISYHKPSGGWTNPKLLSSQINASNTWGWGPYVSNDNTYLFFTRQTTSINVFWVRIDNIIDSLKRTNFIPYLKTQVPLQTDTVGHTLNFQIPDSTFIDDDGNNTLTYRAASSGGGVLPVWMKFDSTTGTFTGTPTISGTFGVTVTVTDTANTSASCTFSFIVVKATGVKETGQLPKESQLFQNYPNPFNPYTTIRYLLGKPSMVKLFIYDILGQKIKTLRNAFQSSGEHTVVWDARDEKNQSVSSGVYFYKLEAGNSTIQKQMVLIK